MTRNALQRAVWTALAVFLPLAPQVIAVDASYKTVLNALSAVAFAFVFSLVTSLAQLPEDVGKEYSKIVAVLLRAARTLAQSFLALAVADLLWGNFTLDIVLQAVAATVVTLIRTLLMSLPEAALDPVLRD